jgi:hypothetical protein
MYPRQLFTNPLTIIGEKSITEQMAKPEPLETMAFVFVQDLFCSKN